MSVGTAGALPAVPPNAGVIGQGIKYPPTLDGKGRLVLSFGIDLLDQQIQSLCLTQPFERVMQPNYGAASETFEPADLARFKAVLEQQIALHVPQVESAEIDVSIEPNGIVVANIVYTPRGDASERTLTFPLYTPPALTGASK